MNFYKETPNSTLSEYDIEFFRQDKDGIGNSANAHIHPALEILYITDGEFKMDIDGSISNARAGDIILIRANTVHSVYHLNDRRGQYYVLKLSSRFMLQNFKGDDSNCILPFLRNRKSDQSLLPSSELSDEIKSVWEKMISEYSSGGAMMLSMEKAYACVLIISMYRDFFSKTQTDGDEHISRDMIRLIHESVGYINDNFASNITPMECAKRVNLSYSYYALLFRTIIGKSFKEYLTGLRMANAYNALRTTELSVTDIAFSCGYNNPSHFTAEYRKYYGATPSDTRKRG